jgi:hypothetical protein
VLVLLNLPSYQVISTLHSLPIVRTTAMPSETINEKSPLLYAKQKHPKDSVPKHVLVIHGGAGTILRERSTPEQQARYHAGLRAALQAGYAVLNSGGEAMDAAVAAASVMEGKS